MVETRNDARRGRFPEVRTGEHQEVIRSRAHGILDEFEDLFRAVPANPGHEGIIRSHGGARGGEQREALFAREHEGFGIGAEDH